MVRRQYRSQLSNEFGDRTFHLPETIHDRLVLFVHDGNLDVDLVDGLLHEVAEALELGVAIAVQLLQHYTNPQVGLEMMKSICTFRIGAFEAGDLGLLLRDFLLGILLLLAKNAGALFMKT